MDPSKISQVKHLYEVERLTMQQIAAELGMCHKTVSRIVTGEERPKKPQKPVVLAPYLRLIDEWHARRPSLKATQVYERLKDYGYTGKYTAVSSSLTPGTPYPRSSMEFFLDGHIEAYKEIKGAARSNWYDNLKSVVVQRNPLTFNPQFVDYARHMGFVIHACNPGKRTRGKSDKRSKKLCGSE